MRFCSNLISLSLTTKFCKLDGKRSNLAREWFWVEGRGLQCLIIHLNIQTKVEQKRISRNKMEKEIARVRAVYFQKLYTKCWLTFSAIYWYMAKLTSVR